MKRLPILVSIAVAGSIALGPTLPAAAARGGTFASQDLATAGDGSPFYRIPALTTTKKGTLLAAYDARPTLADLPSNIRLILRRSTDGGKTWQAPQTVRSDPAPKGYGDPSLVTDTRTGRIFLFHAAGVNQGFFGSTTGNDPSDPNILQTDYSYSDDDGRTWQHRRITQEVKDPSWAGTFAASGQAIQLQRGRYAGRIIQQYVVRKDAQNYAVSAYSDDHGKTWQHGQLVGPGMDENKTVELADGRVMLNSRATPHRLVAYSTDGGVTYTQPVADQQLIDPADNGSIIRLDPKAKPGNPEAHKLLFSNNESTSSRTNLVIKQSCDDGQNWPIRKVVTPGDAAYSTLTRLKNGKFGLLWESKGYGAITYTAFDQKWLGGICAPLTVQPPATASAGRTTIVKVRVTSQERRAIKNGRVTLADLPAGWSAGSVGIAKLKEGQSRTVRIPVTVPVGVATNAYPFRAVFRTDKGSSSTPTTSSIVVRGGQTVWSDTTARNFTGESLVDVSDQFGALKSLSGGAVEVRFRTTKTAPAAALLSSADPISAYRDLVVALNNGTPYVEYRTAVSSYPVRISTTTRVDDGKEHTLVFASNNGVSSLILDGKVIGQASGQGFFKQLDDITPVFTPNNPSGLPNLTLGGNRAFVNGALTDRWLFTGDILGVSVSNG